MKCNNCDKKATVEIEDRNYCDDCAKSYDNWVLDNYT